EDLATLFVDDRALAVEDVVVLEDVLADLVVLRLDLALRGGDRAGDHLGLQGVIPHPGGRHDAVDDAGVEAAHEAVLEGEVEAALPRVALTSGAAAELVVDPAGLMALGAQHIQSATAGDLVVLGRD